MVPSSSSIRRTTMGDLPSRTSAKYSHRTTIPYQDQKKEFLGNVAWLAAILLLVLFGAAMAGEGGLPEEKKLVPFADTFISSRHHERERDERSINFGNKEMLEVIRGDADRSGNFGGWKGTLIRFDLSSIPSGAEIREARLFLYHYNHAGEVISIHRMEKDWIELGARGK
jgi:hypothetical protein